MRSRIQPNVLSEAYPGFLTRINKAMLIKGYPLQVLQGRPPNQKYCRLRLGRELWVPLVVFPIVTGIEGK